MRLETRKVFGWGASGAGSASPKNGLVIHYDGSDQDLAGGPHSECQKYWRETRQFHMGSQRGWADVGYSFAACPHGVVLEGRGLGKVQAAQPGGNSTWYSCTLMSGPSETPNTAQINAVRELRAWLRSKGLGAAVRGHRDFISTSCPGDRAYAMVRNGTFTGTPTTTSAPQEEFMKTVVDLGAKKPQTIPAGQRKSLVFEVEYQDREDIHTDGSYPSVFIEGGDAPYAVSVEVILAERPGPDVQVTVASYARKSDVFERDIRGAELVGARTTLHSNVRMSDKHKYRADVVNGSDADVVVEQAFLLIAH